MIIAVFLCFIEHRLRPISFSRQIRHNPLVMLAERHNGRWKRRVLLSNSRRSSFASAARKPGACSDFSRAINEHSIQCWLRVHIPGNPATTLRARGAGICPGISQRTAIRELLHPLHRRMLRGHLVTQRPGPEVSRAQHRDALSSRMARRGR